MILTSYKQHNHAALLRVLAALYGAVGLVAGGMVARLPRYLRLSVLRQLRPFESAVRRLVFVNAQGLTVEPPAERPAPTKQTRKTKKTESTKSARKPSFPLIEPSVRTDQAPGRRFPEGPGPRMFLFDDSDAPYVAALPPAPNTDDQMDAWALCRRLLALDMVLGDMPNYARRLAMWQARKNQILKQKGPLAAGRTNPLRCGSPPGHRRNGSDKVDEILRECEWLVLWSLKPDTS